jgi:hypothetical protein
LNLIRVMPAKGLDASFAQLHAESPFAFQLQEILVMDNITNSTPRVTTRPLPASGKV